MRFTQDPAKITRVVWSKTDAPGIPYENVFYSRTWEQKGGLNQDALGEVFGTQTWHGHDPPYAQTPGGPCGTAVEWLNGVAPADVALPVPTWPQTSIPLCCPFPPSVGPAGIGIQVPQPCCANLAPGPYFFSWYAPVADGCVDTTIRSVQLLPFTGDCGLAPPGLGNAWAVTPVIDYWGTMCQIVLFCNTPGFSPTSGSFIIGQPGNPCTPVFPSDNYAGFTGDLQCIPSYSGYGGPYVIQNGPCAGSTVEFVMFS